MHVTPLKQFAQLIRQSETSRPVWAFLLLPPFITLENSVFIFINTTCISVCCLFESLEFPHPIENHLFAGFLHLSSENEFVQESVDFVKVKHYVQLADI